MATRKKKASKKRTRGSARKARPARSKGSWGGARPGAGRPLGSGKGPSPASRRNRIAVMLTDAELHVLKQIARAEKQPVSTTAYAIIERRLRRKT